MLSWAPLYAPVEEKKEVLKVWSTSFAILCSARKQEHSPEAEMVGAGEVFRVQIIKGTFMPAVGSPREVQGRAVTTAPHHSWVACLGLR